MVGYGLHGLNLVIDGSFLRPPASCPTTRSSNADSSSLQQQRSCCDAGVSLAADRDRLPGVVIVRTIVPGGIGLHPDRRHWPDVGATVGCSTETTRVRESDWPASQGGRVVHS